MPRVNPPVGDTRWARATRARFRVNGPTCGSHDTVSAVGSEAYKWDPPRRCERREEVMGRGEGSRELGRGRQNRTRCDSPSLLFFFDIFCFISK
jgi:hypothetical protein